MARKPVIEANQLKKEFQLGEQTIAVEDLGSANGVYINEQPVQPHSWELGDIILWDNRQLIHRAGYMAPTDYQTIYRLGIDDRQPFYQGTAA